MGVSKGQLSYQYYNKWDTNMITFLYMEKTESVIIDGDNESFSIPFNLFARIYTSLDRDRTSHLTKLSIQESIDRQKEKK